MSLWTGSGLCTKEDEEDDKDEIEGYKAESVHACSLQVL